MSECFIPSSSLNLSLPCVRSCNLSGDETLHELIEDLYPELALFNWTVLSLAQDPHFTICRWLRGAQNSPSLEVFHLACRTAAVYKWRRRTEFIKRDDSQYFKNLQRLKTPPCCGTVLLKVTLAVSARQINYFILALTLPNFFCTF